MKDQKMSLSRKFAAPLAIGVVATCAMMMAVLAFMLVGRENALLTTRAEGNSRIMLESLSFAMSNGVTDVSPIEETLKGFQDITDFRVLPLPLMTSRSRPAADAEEKEVFSAGEPRVQSLDKGRTLRVTAPMKATEICLACHVGISSGEVVAVTSMYISTADSRKFIGRFTIQAALLTIAATLILILVVWTTLRLVVIKPLLRMRDLVGDIAHGEGDLTKRVTISSRDEVGEVAGLVNGFVEQTHDVVLGIRRLATLNAGNADTLGSTAERTKESAVAAKTAIESTRRQLAELNEQNASVSASAAEILGGITTLTSRIEEQSKSINQSSSAIAQMSASIESVAKVTDRKLEAANQLLVVTRKGGEMVSEVNAEITEISRSVKDIGDAINLINGIAAQTNLLSMNASIEAAHAGQYGAGFAVVAEEIRHLAESSAKNAKTVTSVLKHIIKKIEHALEASTESSGSLTHIGAEVAELVQAFNEIAESTRELAAGGRDILQASESLMQSTAEIRDGSAEMNGGAERIAEAHVEIARISSLSKDAMDEVAKRAVEIDADMGEIAELSTEGRAVSQKLSGAVGRFTVDESVKGDSSF